MATRETADRAAVTKWMHAARTAAAAAAVMAIAGCGGGGGGAEPPADAGGGAGGGGGAGAGGSGGGGGTTTYAVTVTRAGTGSGSVSSLPAGVDCGAMCSANFTAGTSLTLMAVPSAGSSFAEWGGACSGTGPSVTVTVSAAAACQASFALTPTVGNGTSSECEDPLAERTGRRTVRRYASMGSQLEYVQTVAGPTTVNGQTATEFRERTTYLSGPAAGQTSDATTFSRSDPDAYKTFAMQTSSQAGALTTTIDYVLDPYQAFPRGLSPGQTFAHTFNRRTIVNGGTPTTTALVDTYRFLSFADVTVPAGNFTRACRWSVTQQGVTTNMWLARGSGITLKVDNVMELLSAEIDGVPVTP